MVHARPGGGWARVIERPLRRLAWAVLEIGRCRRMDADAGRLSAGAARKKKHLRPEPTTREIV